MSKRRYLNDDEARLLGLEPRKPQKDKNLARYSISEKDFAKILKHRSDCSLKNEVKSTSTSKDYSSKNKALILSAWSEEGFMMDIDEYCKKYKLPRKDITSYKLVSHTGTPFYNIVFKENVEISNDFDFKSIVKKYVKRVKVKPLTIVSSYDFDMATYTDLHVGMDTNKSKNSMYATLWNREFILETAKLIVEKILSNKKANILFVDELGDLLDGYNALTTRGGHSLPQNMTNEEAFDCAYEFKMYLLDNLVNHYVKVVFNNVCNDNHAGAFGYFVNQAFKHHAELKYDSVLVKNHRTFLSHYFVKDICFVISHGKDDSTLKFGFKPQLDTKQIEKIDQYIKHNNIYAKSKRIIFKKGDSHQLLFDMATSDDFDYYNYPALSPSSQWVQNNFKKGRRGFVLEHFKGLENTILPIFIR